MTRLRGDPPPVATDKELDALRAVRRYGSERRAALALKVKPQVIHERLRTVRRRLGVRHTADAAAILLDGDTGQAFDVSA